MRLRNLLTSTVFHIVIVIIMTVGIGFSAKRDIVLPPPITVEFATVAELTQTPTPSVQPSPPQTEEEEKPEPQRSEDRPKPAPTNTSATPVAPPPSERPEEARPETPPPAPQVRPSSIARPEAPPEPEPEPEPEDSNKKASEKQDAPPEKEEPQEPAKPQRDFGSVLRNLAESDPAEAEGEESDQDTSTAGQQAPLGTQLTISELDALRRQLEGCWNVPIGAREVDDMVIDVNLVVNQDRTIREARIVDTARYNRDSFYRAVADSAMRAVRSPSCSPLRLPEDKYDMWKNIIVEFNPKEMF